MLSSDRETFMNTFIYMVEIYMVEMAKINQRNVYVN